MTDKAIPGKVAQATDEDLEEQTAEMLTRIRKHQTVTIELDEADIKAVRAAWKSFAKNSAGIGDVIPEMMSTASILNHFFDKVLVPEDTKVGLGGEHMDYGP